MAAMVKPQLIVRVPPELLEKLNGYIERTGTSKTDVVVSAIAAYLGSDSHLPLSHRVAKLESQVEQLQELIKQ